MSDWTPFSEDPLRDKLRRVRNGWRKLDPDAKRWFHYTLFVWVWFPLLALSLLTMAFFGYLESKQ